MTSKEEFEFLNSDLWLKYTQNKYTPLDDIKYRLDKLGISKSNWPELKQKIQTFRKMGAIPFFINSTILGVIKNKYIPRAAASKAPTCLYKDPIAIKAPATKSEG